MLHYQRVVFPVTNVRWYFHGGYFLNWAWNHRWLMLPDISAPACALRVNMFREMVVSKSSLSRLSIIWWFHCRSWEPTLVKRHLKLPMPSMVSSHLSWHEAWIPGKGFAAMSGVTFESRFEAKLWQLFVSWKFVGKTSQKCHGSSSCFQRLIVQFTSVHHLQKNH